MTTHLRRTLLLLLLSFSLSFGTAGLLAEFEAKPDATTGQWLISENGVPVLQYNYKTVALPVGYLESLEHGKEYAVPRSNYIHPLFGLDGKPITRDWAPDHAHHRGIYWAWPEVGYNGELADLHALQRVFARPNGKIDASEKNGCLMLQAENVWKWKDDEPIVHETAIITVHPLGKSGRKVDLEFHFKGLVNEVTLARRGTIAYGGLNIRMNPLDNFQSGAFLENGEKTAKGDAAWVCGTWKCATTGKSMELTVFEDVTNPDYPGEYVHFPYIHWFQSTFPQSGTRFVVKKDETLVLRYQLWLHEATLDDASKKENWKAFQRETKP